MKNIIRLLATFSLVAAFSYSFAQKSVDYCVRITVEVDENAPSIKLNWIDDNYSVKYYVYRKDAGTKGWGQALTSLDGSATTWTDNTVEIGKAYEYYILEVGNGGFAGYGYVQSGISVPARETEGNLLLMVESSLKDSMPNELETLAMDLKLSGWRVITKYVNDTTAITDVKAMVDAVAAEEELEAVFLFGHIPVPYSGQYCNDSYWIVPPDGHRAGAGNHCGAWAADVYYAVPEGVWTDNDTTIYGANRTANQNLKGDLKWDQATIPGEVKYQLGRVDLRDMPAFGKTEVQLLKQYVQKLHDYKYNLSEVYYKGLIDDNFAANIGAFSTTAWRDFTAALGPDNVDEKDFFTIVKDSTYLLGYGTGGGSYTSCNGVGNTNDFTTKNAAMFSYLFGSFFGDWDIKNNFLRAPLATEKGGLASAWIGRPWWHTFPMALGQTTGYCTRISQNNTTEYANYQLNAFRNNIHIALMGDPTLKLYMFAPPSDLVLNKGGDNRSVQISWTASTDPDVIGYHIYTSDSADGHFGRINSSIITGTSFNHTWPKAGNNYYIVRAVKLETTPSGSYFNLSQGIYGSVDNLQAGSVHDPVMSNLVAYPNPASGMLFIDYQLNTVGDLNIEMIDLTGKIVRSDKISQVQQGTAQIDLTGLRSGVYIVNANGAHQRVVVH